MRARSWSLQVETQPQRIEWNCTTRAKLSAAVRIWYLPEKNAKHLLHFQLLFETTPYLARSASKGAVLY